jgi:cytochrome c5
LSPLQTCLVIVASAFLSACASECEDPAAEEGSAECADRSSPSWRESYLALGEETYTRACASCHDEGIDGAPAIGDREAWSDRSPLWSAILLEHAKSGYLDMPPKGGHPELTEHAVEAAGEYMLGQTFPELLKD